MKSVLIGNGVTIQFGGSAYTSEFIIKRAKFNSKLGRYKKLFNNTLQSQEIINILNQFVAIANEVIKGEYDEYVENKDTADALKDFKSRYTQAINESHDIMLEDWFFLLHIFFLRNSDLLEHNKASKQGFEQIILDAIYNSGEIQSIYKNMNKSVKRYFKNFDNIYTLNYDNNIEMLTGKKVYHLHGDFSVLAHSENPNNVLGFIRLQENSRVLNEEFSHCYCTALLNYSGELKLKEAENNYKSIIDSNEYATRYKYDEDFRQELLKVKEHDPSTYKMIMAKIQYPELKYATEYYFEKFKNIEGELHIIGISPNNDNHIFNYILNNKKLDKVYFYYYSNEEKEYINAKFPKELCEVRQVTKLWSELQCNQRNYNCNYGMPDDVDKFIEVFNSLSNDVVPKERIINEFNSIPRYQMIRLYNLVKGELGEERLNLNPKNEEEFLEFFWIISSIGLRVGVLPSVLIMVYVKISKNI